MTARRAVFTLHLFFVLISLGFIAPTPAFAAGITPLPYSIENAPVIIEAYAVKYGIDARPLIATLDCESQFNDEAVGDYGTSYGLAQIHLPAHPDISKEQALNPFFAIDWAAYQFSQGKQGMWSCYKKLYGGKSP